jgi:hypothetical protein
MRFLLTDSFTSALARLPAAEAKAVKTTVVDLQIDPSGKSLSFHRIDLDLTKERALVGEVVMAPVFEEPLRRPSDAPMFAASIARHRCPYCRRLRATSVSQISVSTTPASFRL